MPDTWVPDPPSPQPPVPHARPWAATISVLIVAAVLVIEALGHDRVLAIAFGLLLVGNLWVAGQLWRDYLRSTHDLVREEEPK